MKQSILTKQANGKSGILITGKKHTQIHTQMHTPYPQKINVHQSKDKQKRVY